jgi:hypothetical protein
MRLEYVSYLPGGYFERDEGAVGEHTRSVDVDCYALQVSPPESGCLLALWAAVGARHAALVRAESLVGPCSFTDLVSLGPEKMARVYGSALPWLQWWRDKCDVFLGLEDSLMNMPVSVYMNLPHGNVLVSSLVWLVTSANCAPAGLNYDFKAEDMDPKLVEGIDVKAMESVSLLRQGRLAVSAVARILNLEGLPALVPETEVKGVDSFLDDQRALLHEFQSFLAPYAGRIPKLKGRFLGVSDAVLGVNLASFCGEFLRNSFPDAFIATRDLEELTARKIREERKASGKKSKPGA